MNKEREREGEKEIEREVREEGTARYRQEGNIQAFKNNPGP